MPYTQQYTQAPSVAQALAYGQETISNKSSSYEQESSVSFDDIVREEAIRKESEAKTLSQKENLKNEQAEELEAERDYKKRMGEEAAKDVDSKDIYESDSTDDTEGVSYDAVESSDASVSEDETEEASNDNSVDNTATANNLVVSFDALPESVQNFLSDLMSQQNADSQTLSVDLSSFAALTDEEKIQALSYITSSEMQDIYGLYSGEENAVSTIDEFMARLKSQSTQSDPAALLSNLTPQQVTAIEDYLSQQPSTKAGQEILNSILALQNIDPDTALSEGGPNGVLAGMSKGEIIEYALNSGVMDDIASILQDLAQIIQPATQQVAQTTTDLPNSALSQQQAALAAQQSAQNTGRLTNTTQSSTTVSADAATLTEDGIPLIGANPDTAEAEFEELISRFTSGNQNNGGTMGASTSSNTQTAAQTSQTTNTTGTQQASAAPTGLSIASSLTSQSSVLSVDDLIMQDLSTSGTTAALPLTTQAMSLTSATTASQTAGQAHPATQAVAATLQKSATTGETKSITLRLDPPELGRVEIQMSFEKNSKIKAILTAERPETHLMMQRDQSVLEKALQDAGFDAEGAIQFELSQDGSAFSQDGSHDQYHQGQSGSQVAEDEVTNIETTMNWSVDNASGHVSYDLLI